MSLEQRAGRVPQRTPIADDGDELHFCSTCAFGSVCLPQGVDKAALRDLHCLVEHVGPYRPGDHVFRTGERFAAIFAVRGGTVKTCLVDDEGQEQVLGFHLPGEMIGLNAIHPAKYPCDAVALDTVYVCRFSFPALATLAMRMPGVQQQLFRLLSEDIGKAALLAGDHYAARGFSPSAFHLSMARADIANYLRLAAETVSRVLRRFQDQGLIEVDGREVRLANEAELRHLARNIVQR
jgi:CRP/FNR family transcriptional regulator